MFRQSFGSFRSLLVSDVKPSKQPEHDLNPSISHTFSPNLTKILSGSELISFPYKEFSRLNVLAFFPRSHFFVAFCEENEEFPVVLKCVKKRFKGSEDKMGEMEEDFAKMQMTNSSMLMRIKSWPRAGMKSKTKAEKILEKRPELKSTKFDAVERELNVLRKLVSEKNKNPFLVEFFGYFSIENEVWIVMESCFGTLRNLAKRAFEQTKSASEKKEGKNASLAVKSFPYELETVYYLTFPIISAVNYLHSIGFIHGDLKESNILITGNGIPKLCDFGCAKSFPVLAKNSNFQKNLEGVTLKFSEEDSIGSPFYVAPEIIRGEDFGPKIDTFGLGMTLLSLKKGITPFYIPPVISWAELSEKFKVSTENSNDNWFFSWAKMEIAGEGKVLVEETLFIALIKQMLALNASRRIGLSEVLKNKAFDTYRRGWETIRSEHPEATEAFLHQKNLVQDMIERSHKHVLRLKD